MGLCKFLSSLMDSLEAICSKHNIEGAATLDDTNESISSLRKLLYVLFQHTLTIFQVCL